MADEDENVDLLIHPDTDIGHVHLKVADLDRAVAFYRDVLGFEVMARVPGAAFLSAGGYHHHIALNTWFSEGGNPPPREATGLYHVAIRYPNRVELARALERLLRHGVAIRETEDHGVSEAIYFADPDGNGLEIYRDRPRADWSRAADGSFTMTSAPIDVDVLLAELGPARRAATAVVS
jgi:catechol 2,3-dioxygenase